MQAVDVESTTRALSRASVAQFTNPHTKFAWTARPSTDAFATSERLITLAAHPLWSTLTDEQKWRAGLHEAAHFFSLNISGERELMMGLAARLHQGTLASASEYLLHFLQEECSHSAVFTRFCGAYLGFVYPDRQMRLPRKFLPGEEEFLFFAQVLVFEMLASWHNIENATDDGVWSLAREIHEYHATDEARHISFGRAVVAALWERTSPGWGEEGRAQVARYLHRYMDSIFRVYANPFVYRDLKLGDGIDLMALRAEILVSPARKAVEREATARPTRFFRDLMGAAFA
jgi:hypothetical protein